MVAAQVCFLGKFHIDWYMMGLGSIWWYGIACAVIFCILHLDIELGMRGRNRYLLFLSMACYWVISN